MDNFRKSEKNETGIDPKAVIQFLGVKASCTASDVLRMLIDERLGDTALLNFASATELSNCPRAKWALALYLSVRGTPF